MTQIRKTAKLIAGIACVTLTITILSASVPAAPHTAPLLEMPFVGPSNCGECGPCIGGHTAGPVEGGDIGSLHSWCMELVGCTGHPACGSSANLDNPSASDEIYQSELNRLLDGDRSDIATFASTYSDKVYLNRTRNSLQIEGCAPGVIAANIPLSSREIASIAAWRLGSSLCGNS